MLMQKEAIVRAMMAGAKGFLVKNVELSELKRSIRAVARGETVLDSQLAARLIDKLKEEPDGDSPPLLLTEQHITIAKLVARGLTNREIAEQLFLSENTIKFHVQNMMRKLDVHNRVAMVTKLIQSNML
ncbi:regulatory protein, luxR family [Desulfoscipio geothermicus DSM 3669]|uniref:Stage 0 sporulation protein A homolog n=2 Tax=Desulfoscipio geothermicus TaxID=39060 RepID=A0A1I6D7I5_9FIRM|nr:regulatory protein, luxR family [Desulfoscipio geothermicus DSM 3669]